MTRRQGKPMTERCEVCGHALSRHNDMGYCSVSMRYVGGRFVGKDCMCGIDDRQASAENRRKATVNQEKDGS